MFASDFGVGQVVVSLIWFFLFFLWIMLVFHVIGDIFRSRDLSGGGKALWLLVVIALNYIGVFIYLIVRGAKMHEHDAAAFAANEAAAREYIRNAAGQAPSAADELERLAGLKDRGVIDEAEFATLKAKVLS